MEYLLRVESNYFVAGAVFERHDIGKYVCVSAAPIIWWMVGKDYEVISNYCIKKKWKLLRIKTGGS